jgi:photosystem II stability/assembly factor-like uncharacterized protein
MKRPPFPTLAVAFVALAAAAIPASRAAERPRHPAAAPAADSLALREMSWRSVGPANMGGRVSSFAVVESHPATFYVGLGTGGVFKTVNQVTTFSPIFDRQPVASIGSIAVWQKNPNVVWVGTGESNSRNSSSWGNGVYRSLDAGATWEHLGLEATHNVSAIVLDPADSNTVYVAALGHLWGPNPERGIFKTTDGGRHWEQVLKVDARTGACDLDMDPGDSSILYASLYPRLRTAWSYEAGGTSGGIFRSRDRGRSWTRLSAGLPPVTGRIGLDVYRKNPRVLFAVIESREGGQLDAVEDKSRAGGVFRSDDRGEHWTRLSPFTPRPFYFSQLRVQPTDSTRIYLLGTDLWVSDDAGVHFAAGGANNLHPDCHAMWVDPVAGERVLLGTDGGVYQSHDRGASWDFLNHIAAGEFYNLALDHRDPYRIYGGLQDNQTWGGPSRTREQIEAFLGERPNEGILNDHWYCLGGGDGFHVAVDPLDDDIVYYESQAGRIHRVNLRSGKERNLRPVAGEGQPTFRFNWNTPFLVSPHDPSVLWLGGNHVFRLLDRGDRWELASPDLTTRNPDRMVSGGSAAEAHCTIVSLTESSVAKGRLWVGTDDGKVWTSPDAGAHWNDVTANLKGAPPGLYVSRVEASHHDGATAYVALDGHRGDRFEPWLLVTRDAGKSWTSIAGDLPRRSPVLVIREDLADPSLLFAGTEFGILFSTDAGKHWEPLATGLPTVAVDDIAIHPRERDLVIGTHGRSVYVLDDITPLEQWREVKGDSITLFAPRAVTAFQPRGIGGIWGQRIFTAKNPPFGATLHYYVPADLPDPVRLVIADSAGREVRKLTGPSTRGVHRVVWDLQAGEPRQRIERPEWDDQPEYVKAGRYTVKLSCGPMKPRPRTLEVRVAPETADPGF